MLKLQQMKEAVDQLSPEERAELRAYLDEWAAEKPSLRAGTMDIDALLDAAREIREGLASEEWDDIQRAMNEDFIEPVDDDGFPRL